MVSRKYVFLETVELLLFKVPLGEGLSEQLSKVHVGNPIQEKKIALNLTLPYLTFTRQQFMFIIRTRYTSLTIICKANVIVDTFRI